MPVLSPVLTSMSVPISTRVLFSALTRIVMIDDRAYPNRKPAMFFTRKAPGPKPRGSSDGSPTVNSLARGTLLAGRYRSIRIGLVGTGVRGKPGRMEDRINSVHARRVQEPSPIIFIGIIRQSRGGSAEDEARSEGDLGLGQHFNLHVGCCRTKFG